MEVTEKETFRDVFITSKRSLAFVWGKERKLVIISIALAIFLAAMVYLQLVSFSTIVNEIIRIQTQGLEVTHALIVKSILLGLSFLLPAVLQNVYSKVTDALKAKLSTEISAHHIDSMASLDIGTVEGAEFQTKLELTRKWGTGSINNVVHYTIGIIRDIAGVLTSGIVLFFINPYLVLLAVLGTIPYYFIENKYGKDLYRLYHVSNDESRIVSERTTHFKEPKKIIEILLFNIKSLFRNQVYAIDTKMDREIIQLSIKKSWATFGADLVLTICLFIAVALVIILTLKGQLLIGSLLLAFTTYRGFANTMQVFFQDSSRLGDQARYAKKWFDIFDLKPKIFSKPDALKPIWEKPPKIAFKNVSFSYPETTPIVLNNISLELESGEKLAIVGENGAGKTTFIKLLARVYDPTEGIIYIDGVDLREIDITHWHNYLGILFQDFNHYRLPLREAIAISRPNDPIDDKKVHWAAEIAGADDFIRQFPKQYEQLIWKGFRDGVELSRGQHQRVAVARILYRDALISVLDEPTSAIDAVAEEKIFDVLETKMEGKTVVLISHRFSTVKNADKIAVIEHGEIKEQGSHKELMKRNGRYTELYTMQAKRYLESED